MRSRRDDRRRVRAAIGRDPGRPCRRRLPRPALHLDRHPRSHPPQGAVLVRPDRFIGWRAHGAATDPVAELTTALDALLAR
ncbi:hypothetical protein ACFWOY_25780 [Streptomyces sp. NPDC058423]|uniref:aromatic-ring hydroxylase C-terminal domain-containing protein n=1 Tax=unclassified Streptomyces TaxID=2593676 RepID=UPI00364E590E